MQCSPPNRLDAQLPGEPIRLTYLDIKSVAEPIRLSLFIGDIHFDDRRIGYDEIKAMRKRGELPFGQVPLLEVGGQSYAQSQAILRWAGRKAGLYPDELQLQCDAVEEALVDMRQILKPQWYGAALGRHPVSSEPLVALTSEQKGEVVRLLNEEILPHRFAQLEQQLSNSGGPYFCGSQMTICDLSFYVYASGVLDATLAPGISATVLDGCPGLRALVERVRAHPRVQEWNARNHASVSDATAAA